MEVGKCLNGRQFCQKLEHHHQQNHQALDPAQRSHHHPHYLGEHTAAEEEADEEEEAEHHHRLIFSPPGQGLQQQQPRKRSYFPSSSSLNPEDSFQQTAVAPPAAAAVAPAGGGRQVGSSRLGLRGSGGGEIVEVQGGHIVRSTGRKDRHSKVCTAKGPRDRRVRLSAHTAIQFYDVQDRLGYDRPSKAVDWLIKKAKSAIDELAQLPAWHPTATCPENGHQQQQQINILGNSASSKRAMLMLGNESSQQQLNSTNNNNNNGSSSFLPPSMDSDSIADTIKSFFPVAASVEANSSAMQFQSFPPPDLLSRTSSHGHGQSQDLRLSLQSFQDPIFHQHQHHHHHHSDHQAIFSTASQMGFDAWPELQQQQQRMGGWSSGGGDATAGGSGGYLFNAQAATAAAPQPFLQQLFGHNQLYSQRGPLQSSSIPSIRAWMDPSSVSIATTEHPLQQQHHHHQAAFLPVYPSSLSSFGFASGVGGFSGFRVPARIQGEEEEHDGISDKPSSASSDSRH